MAADMYIHVIPEQPVKAVREYMKDGKLCKRVYRGTVDEKLFAVFFSNSIGSKWYNLDAAYNDEKWRRAYYLIGNTPSVRVGEVSWLKAALLDDVEQFVPSPIYKIDTLIGEDFPVIDDQLIKKVAEALQLENKTDYELNDPKEIIGFLEQHKGMRCITIAW